MPVASSRGSYHDHHRSKISQQSESVLHDHIRTHLHIPVRNKSFTIIVIIVSDRNGIANSIVTILSACM